MKETKIISGFPAIGKSSLFKNNNDYSILDSDSIDFSWVDKTDKRNPDFPNNYIKHIKENIGKVDYILISTHHLVRKELENNKMDYTIVYPSIELKEEYMERIKKRGNTEAFAKIINDNWEKFIKEIESETFPKLIKLNKGQYLSDVISKI
ncbi:hypothetical protein Bp8pS_014 [Bacillus phage vB_BpuM-BpSp]|nr:hypothetical protein Bp8pS_014 [Bacillus phage vB_BpuM-BpSp]